MSQTPDCSHALFEYLQHVIHLFLFRKSCSCPGRGFICWVTVWEHMLLESLETSLTIKSAESQVSVNKRGSSSAHITCREPGRA